MLLDARPPRAVRDNKNEQLFATLAESQSIFANETRIFVAEASPFIAAKNCAQTKSENPLVKKLAGLYAKVCDLQPR